MTLSSFAHSSCALRKRFRDSNIIRIPCLQHIKQNYFTTLSPAPYSANSSYSYIWNSFLAYNNWILMKAETSVLHPAGWEIVISSFVRSGIIPQSAQQIPHISSNSQMFVHTPSYRQFRFRPIMFPFVIHTIAERPIIPIKIPWQSFIMSIRIKINIKRALSMLMSIEMSIIPYISTYTSPFWLL